MNSLKNTTEKINELKAQIKALESVCGDYDNTRELILFRKQLAVQYNNRAHILYKLVDFDKAIGDYCSAIDCDNSLAIAYYNRATISYRMSRFDKSVDDFKIALMLEPSNKEFQCAYEDSVKQLNNINKIGDR